MNLLIPKKWLHFFLDNSAPDFLFTRPSGNPTDAIGFEQMITCDIEQERAEITKIHRFEFLSDDVLMCIFTPVSKFTYKDLHNNEKPKASSIFKKVNNVLKIDWMQQSTRNSDLSLCE